MTEDGPLFCNVRDAQAREEHKPFSCPDKTLTALCQLGAFRFNVCRCLLFFFDVNNAYVLAEATRSLSLEDDNIHDQDDQLWLGHAMIPRSVASCENTVKLPALTETSPERIRNSVFVVNDLTKHPETQDQPCVTSYPYGRFYVGVPVTSPAGINIGAYCVLGDHPRESNSISEKDVLFMRDMSRTVMTHLETLRARSERQRTAHMVTGLGAFVQGSSDSRRWERRIAKHKARIGSPGIFERSGLISRRSHRIIQCSIPDTLRTTEGAIQDIAESVKTRSEYFDPKTVGLQEQYNELYSGKNDQQSTEVRPGMLGLRLTGLPPLSIAGMQNSKRVSDSCELHGSEHSQTQDPANTPPNPTRQRSTETGSPLLTPQSVEPTRVNAGRPLLGRSDSNANKSAYQRASEIMCESLSVDGVAFVDASVGTFGGLTDTIEATDSGSSTHDGMASASGTPDAASSFVEFARKPCLVLGCASSVRERDLTGLERQPAKKMTEECLRTLLRRHPHGRIWTFDQRGVTLPDDSWSSDNDESQKPSTRRQYRRRKAYRRDGGTLQAMFPGARTVAIHGIRDQYLQRLTVGCVIWSFDVMRIFTIDTEMNFVAAFCDVIVGENRRLEAQRSDKAKTSFVASISHDLRSPIHGILGSTEVLKDFDLNSTAMALVEQTEVCGRTLLDIIDHLLEFSEVKDQRVTHGVVSSSKIGRMLAGKKSSAKGDISDIDVDFALDDVTEEVMETTVYSYFCKRGPEERSRTSIVLDIDRSSNIKWNCQLASGGWKRICMNLVNNALKYTESGFVRASMQQTDATNLGFNAILTISDSGKGMSKAFIDEGLLQDFAQEDTNADGMGIGMSMVGRMVHAMGGSVEVNSDQFGAGTCITVSVPLQRGQTLQDRGHPANRYTVGDVFNGLSVGIVLGDHARRHFTSDPGEQLKTTSSTLAIASIEKTCKYLGLEPQTGSWEDCNATNLNFMLEEDFSKEVALMQSEFNAQGKSPISRIPSVVVCKNNPSAHKLLEAWRNDPHYPGIVTEYIASPCGVRTIARAVSSALGRHKESKDVASTQLQRYGVQRASTFPTIINTHHDTEVSAGKPSVGTGIDGTQTVTGSTLLPWHNTKMFDEPRQRDTRTDPKNDIPQAHQQIASSQGSPGSAQNALVASNSESPVLLLVDDNSINLQLLVTYAKRRNYAYLTAVDGQFAIDAYIEAHESSSAQISAFNDTSLGRPSVVLMDLNMPRVDGYQSTQRIRAYEKKHQLPPSLIIALSALGSAAAHKEAFGSGFDMFMTKPVKLKNLTEIIEGGRRFDSRQTSTELQVPALNEDGI